MSIVPCTKYFARCQAKFKERVLEIIGSYNVL